MLQLYSKFNQELLTIGGSSNNIKLKIYSSNDPISNSYLIGQSNHALYITTLCNLPTYVGIGTSTPTRNLHVVGNSFLSGSLTVGTITTQNNFININSGTLYGTLFANNITSGQITTQNNIINAGSGIIYASNIYIMGNIYDSNNQPYSIGGSGGSGGGTFTSGQSITTGIITTQNNSINLGSGIIYTTYLGAYNVSQILKNILKKTYISSVSLTYTNLNTFTINIIGNASSYTYSVYEPSTNTILVSNSSTVQMSSTFTYSLFVVGSQHTIIINANTSSIGGSDYGSIATYTLTFIA